MHSGQMMHLDPSYSFLWLIWRNKYYFIYLLILTVTMRITHHGPNLSFITLVAGRIGTLSTAAEFTIATESFPVTLATPFRICLGTVWTIHRISIARVGYVVSYIIYFRIFLLILSAFRGVRPYLQFLQGGV